MFKNLSLLRPQKVSRLYSTKGVFTRLSNLTQEYLDQASFIIQNEENSIMEDMKKSNKQAIEAFVQYVESLGNGQMSLRSMANAFLENYLHGQTISQISNMVDEQQATTKKTETSYFGSDSCEEATRHRLWEELLEWDVEISHSEPLIEPQVEDLEMQMGREIAMKWLRIIEMKPWQQWTDLFVPFLPSNTSSRKHFNAKLKRYFDVHGRALWERYFWTGASAAPYNVGPSRRFVHARAELGLLVHELYQLEGNTVFLFLDKYSHPFWPDIQMRPIDLNSNSQYAVLKYLEEQHMQRWPKHESYFTFEDTPCRFTQYNNFRGCRSFIHWAGHRSKGSCAADGWLAHGATPQWFMKLFMEIQAGESLDVSDTPYIHVILPDHSPPSHCHLASLPPPRFVFDWEKQCVLERND